jgi:hypothetical protein
MVSIACQSVGHTGFLAAASANLVSGQAAYIGSALGLDFDTREE